MLEPSASPTTPAPTSVCTQYGGILGGSDVCCNAGCSQCGGTGCYKATIDGFRRDYDTTTQSCCVNTIREKQKYCSKDGAAPCMIRQTSAPTPIPSPEPTANPTRSPTSAPTVEPKEWCERQAELRGEGFIVKYKSNGAPQGCVRYNNGGVVWVQTCENHPNCGTSRCNGCTVLTPLSPQPTPEPTLPPNLSPTVDQKTVEPKEWCERQAE